MNIFVTADMHLGHYGVTTFLSADGSKLRPWTDKDEMTSDLIDNFNSTVGVYDKCYILGDLSLKRKNLDFLKHINCKKLILVKGNHDVAPLTEYAQYFSDIRACHVFEDMILTHIPIHTCQLPRFISNVHGHLHDAKVHKVGPNGDQIIDPQYLCVSVEQTDFKPISIEEVRSRIIAQGGTLTKDNL